LKIVTKYSINKYYSEDQELTYIVEIRIGSLRL
jgi:hypothetical protein